MWNDPHRTRGRKIGRVERRADMVPRAGERDPKTLFLRDVELVRRPGQLDSPNTTCAHMGVRR